MNKPNSCITILFILLTALLVTITVMPLAAQSIVTLHNFDGTDGDQPSGALVQTTNGDFYGTTTSGGVSGLGSIYRMTPGGALTTVYSFSGADGSGPLYSLIQGTDGNLYGTTSGGGAGGAGTIFRMTLDGILTTLHSFDGDDGDTPYAGVVQGSNGRLYGDTIFGGSRGYGVLYAITTDGVYHLLHNFTGSASDGAYAYGDLIQANDGNLYGTTFSGGGAFEGTVFRLTPSGAFSMIYAFCLAGIPCPDGGNVQAGVIQASDGNLYGTVVRGGSTTCTLNGYDGCGTLFGMTLSGTLTTLHPFDITNGGNPVTRLMQATDGNLYGVTSYGGANDECSGGCGTLFKASLDGAITTLYNFCSLGGCADGSFPVADLVQGTNGAIYGTTNSGGTNNDGIVFGFSIGAAPFAETNPVAGTVGAAVRILGSNLTGSTSVAFNGTSAAFTVVSHSEITTTVPAGATTGVVQVTTPTAVLQSNVPFRVIP